MATPVPRREGWGWPANSQKAHYFDGARSLCSKWIYIGSLIAFEATGGDFCTACFKAVGKRLAKDQVEALKQGAMVVR